MPAPNQNEPLNLLSFDGGGVRGVSTLVILDHIMRRLQEKEGLDNLPKPCDWFDLIAGTSTGGLIAILLGRLRMTTQQALEMYDSVAGDIFSRRNRKKHKFFPMYNATTLEAAVQEIVRKYTDSDLMIHPEAEVKRGKAFVCAVEASNQAAAQRFRAYECDDGDVEWLKDCKIWEAARATTAAPVYFKDITLQRGEVAKRYVDAALGYNNPTEVLLDEAARVFYRTRKLGAVVSLGTGTRSRSLVSPQEVGHITYAVGAAKTMKDITVDTEAVHRRVQNIFKDVTSTYFRFNLPDGAAKVKLNGYKQMSMLKEMTASYLKQKHVADEIEALVDVLRLKKTQHLTIGHVCSLDVNQMLLDTQRAQRMGSSSAFFTGRARLLKQLRDHFPSRPRSERSRRQFLLCGMGGAGKTQIALKFAETAVAEASETERLFERFFWIDATDVVTANQGFEEIAKEAFPDKEPGEMSAQAVLKWIGALDEEWLLVLDNATDKTAEKVIPPGNRGNILFTSKDQEIGRTLPPAAVAEVNDMEREDAITLLLKAAGHAVAYNPVLRDEAAPVVDQLGCLALAVDQAGAYIRNLKLSIREYEELLKSKKTDMFRDPRFKGADSRNQAVYATFDISLRAITDYVKEYQGYVKGEDARNALKILRLICFYHNEAVMFEMFRRAAETDQETPRDERHLMGPGTESPQNLIALRDGVWDSEPLRYGLRILENFSLVKLDAAAQTVSMHVLVQAWARDSMEEQDRVRHATRARIILFDSIPGKRKLEDYRLRLRLSPHIVAFLEKTDIRLDDAHMESFFDCKLGVVYTQMGKWDEAEAAFKSALDYRRGIEEPDDDWILDVIRGLSRLYHQAHRYADAEAVELELVEARRSRIKKIEEYITWEESLIESNAIETTATARKRSEFRFLQSMHPVSDKAPQPDFDRHRSLNFAREQLQRSHVKLGIALHGLVVTYMAQTDLDLAERACIESTEVRRIWNPAGVPSCQRIMQTIADVRAGTYKIHHSVQEADTALKDALAQYGENSLETLRALRKLVQAEINCGDAQHAEPHAIDYLTRCCEVFGENHDKSVDALSLHGDILAELGDHIAAEEKYREALRRAQKGLGIYHPTTARMLSLVAGPIRDQGRVEEANLLTVKSQELLTAVYGANHAMVRDCAPSIDFILTKCEAYTTGLAMENAEEAWKKHNARRLQIDLPVADRDLFQWVKYNHLSKHWGDGTRPEEVYFDTRPPLITSLFQGWYLTESSDQPESSTARDPDLVEEFL